MTRSLLRNFRFPIILLSYQALHRTRRPWLNVHDNTFLEAEAGVNCTIFNLDHSACIYNILPLCPFHFCLSPITSILLYATIIVWCNVYRGNYMIHIIFYNLHSFNEYNWPKDSVRLWRKHSSDNLCAFHDNQGVTSELRSYESQHL